MRTVPEWIGATDDTPPPRKVRDRIWLREGGRCYLTGRKIQVGDAFDYEHVIAIANGGENRESNIRLALKAAHKVKTRADRDEQSRTERMRAKHFGYFPKTKRPLKSRGFEPSRKDITHDH